MNTYAELSIGDVSRITNTPAYTLRFWEKEFSVFLTPNRTPGMQRRFSEEDIKVIEEIKHLLKIEGYSIAGAKRQLAIRHNNFNNNSEIAEPVDKINGIIDRIKEELLAEVA